MSDPELTERQRRSLTIVDRNARRLVLLVQDLLDVARLQGGRLTLQKSPVNVATLLSECVESFHQPARQAGVSLALAAGGDLSVEADAGRLSQVVYNLLGNAVKFTPSGGRIEARATRQGDEVVVEVQDSGAGLSPDQVGRLFQPFEQVHVQPLAKPGTGLGLFISKGIVEQHGGRIWVRSDGPGKGSTFAFAVPAK
jgi:two-component system, chemotaxis family, sensor kinase Cph1